MHRIDGPGAAPGNLFTEGDPTLGVPATTVTGAWLNAVQEEIANTIEAAGIQLSKPDNTQLHAAILALIAANQQIGFETGDVKLTLATVAPPGWVMCDDGTIGPSGSGATSREDDDTEALYKLIWNNIPDGFAPVSGGRGASADADWAAGKPIALTRMLGRVIGIAGDGAGLTSRQLGQFLGAETHTLTVAEMPAHTHGPGTLGGELDNIGRGGGTGGPGGQGASHFDAIVPFALSTGESGSTGGDQPHNNMQPTVFLNAMVKL